MSSLNQYLDLWSEHSELVKTHSPALLNKNREEAAEVLRKTGLPKAGSRDYRNIDLEQVLAPDFGLNIARIPMEVDLAASFRCEIPKLTTSPFFVSNDTLRKLPDLNLPDGVEVISLTELTEREPEFAEKYYGKLADISNPIVALNTLFCQDGICIRIGEGVKAEKPLQLINILHSLVPYMAIRRLLIVVGQGAEASLLVCDHTQVPDVDLASVQVVEIYADEDSKFQYYDLEESTEQTSRLSSLWLRQERGSHVVVDGITLFNGTTRNEYFVNLSGSGAEVKLLGMAIEDGDRRQETFSKIHHDSPNCKTDELFKYVVDDRASGSFIGRICVAPGSSGTEAYQSNRNLLGSDTAKMYSKPELEIYNDDVKCSHGSATGQLDPMQLFYMRTRGLSLDEARLLLKQAFMADVIEAIDLPVLSERLRHLVEMRFAGLLTSSCAGCRSCGV